MAKSNKAVEHVSSAYPVIIVMAKTLKQLDKAVNNDHPEFSIDRPSKGRMISWWRGNTFCIGIYADTPASLAHECVHAKNEIMQYSGIKHDFDNDEIEAYMVEYLYKEYCKAVREEWLHG